jgi:uncharacterized protein YbbC (DUF1343 family)
MHDAPQVTARVRTGLDRVAAGDAGIELRGRAVALLCHPASVTASLRHAPEVLRDAGARLVALLGPEHGIDATAQDMIGVGHGDDTRASGATEGPPGYSLYGADFESLSPRLEMFHGAELLVCDLQDVGSRYYTYVWTVVLAAEVALREGLGVVVLDRPNPLGGLAQTVEGGGIAEGFESFVGLHSVAARHGMTLGELATMALTERARAPLERLMVVDCVGWRRADAFQATGLPWVMPSPNMPTLETAFVYPGQCLLEGTNLSEGRGTTRPFEIFGAPWLDGRRLAAEVERRHCPGLSLRPLRFEPTFHKFAGSGCGGLQLHVEAAGVVRSLATTWELLRVIYRQSAGALRWRTEKYEFVDHIPALDLLAGGAWLRDAIEAGTAVDELLAHVEGDRQAFLRRRERFLRHA